MEVVRLGNGEQCLCMVFRQADDEQLVLIYTKKEQLYRYLRGLGAQAYRSAGLCRFHAGIGLDWERFTKEVVRRAAGKSVVATMEAVIEAANTLGRERFKIATNKPVQKMDYRNLFFCQRGGAYICDSEIIARGKGGEIFPFSCRSEEELVYLMEQSELGLKMEGHRFSFPKMVLYTKRKFSDEDARRYEDAEMAAMTDSAAVLMA